MSQSRLIDVKSISGKKELHWNSFWNMAAMGIMGLAGIMFNILVGRYYDASVLGIFNQVLSLHLLFSQLSVGGVHLSVLRHIPDCIHQPGRAAALLTSALIVSSFLGIFSCLILAFSAEAISTMLNSSGVYTGLFLILPGVWFFGINKILFSALNATEHHKTFAFFNGFRYILILLFLILAIHYRVVGNNLPLILTLTELVLFITVGLRVWKLFKTPHRKESMAPWMREHLVFGIRAWFSNLLTEINSYVDIILLGIFLSDAMVGIYSFAAMFATGMLQFSSAVRQVISPRLTHIVREQAWDQMTVLIREARRVFLPLMALMCGMAWLLFPVLVQVLVGREEYLEGTVTFGILLLGVTLSAPYMPFQLLLNQAGFPGRNGLLMLFILLTNVVGNLLLIPRWGMEGSAVATTFSLIVIGPYLRIMTRQTLGVDPWSNKSRARE